MLYERKSRSLACAPLCHPLVIANKKTNNKTYMKYFRYHSRKNSQFSINAKPPVKVHATPVVASAKT